MKRLISLFFALIALLDLALPTAADETDLGYKFATDFLAEYYYAVEMYTPFDPNMSYVYNENLRELLSERIEYACDRKQLGKENFTLVCDFIETRKYTDCTEYKISCKIGYTLSGERTEYVQTARVLIPDSKMTICGVFIVEDLFFCATTEFLHETVDFWSSDDIRMKKSLSTARRINRNGFDLEEAYSFVSGLIKEYMRAYDLDEEHDFSKWIDEPKLVEYIETGIEYDKYIYRKKKSFIPSGYYVREPRMYFLDFEEDGYVMELRGTSSSTNSPSNYSYSDFEIHLLLCETDDGHAVRDWYIGIKWPYYEYTMNSRGYNYAGDDFWSDEEKYQPIMDRAMTLLVEAKERYCNEVSVPDSTDTPTDIEANEPNPPTGVAMSLLPLLTAIILLIRKH